jgi:hypothetical protein
VVDPSATDPEIEGLNPSSGSLMEAGIPTENLTQAKLKDYRKSILCLGTIKTYRGQL